MAAYIVRATSHAEGHSAPRGRSLRVEIMGLALFAAVIGAGATAAAQDREIGARRANERKTFTDTEITEGFLKVALGAEYQLDGRSDRIRKYDGPVRVYVENRGRPDRTAEVAEVVVDIRARINNLDIATTDRREAANVIVTLVRDGDLGRTIREFYGKTRAQRIQKSLKPQCLSAFRKDETFRIVRSEVILVVDAGNAIFYDCVYEELLQALGPINDVDIPWTMFNDDVQMGFFGVYDQYLLNILYDRRIQPGMTIEQVRAVLPQVLPDVRAFVARVNGLPQ
jgi:hypothetical protein